MPLEIEDDSTSVRSSEVDAKVSEEANIETKPRPESPKSEKKPVSLMKYKKITILESLFCGFACNQQYIKQKNSKNLTKQ